MKEIGGYIEFEYFHGKEYHENAIKLNCGRNCLAYLIEAYKLAVWDENKVDTRLDDGTTPIDDLDASEYSMFPFYDKLMLNMK